MRYVKIDGSVFCRYARTPPILNSHLASEYGVQARMGIKPYPGITIEEGRNVKLRLILAVRKIRLTCHARIDRVEVDATTGEYLVFFSQLSLSDIEFGLLLEHISEAPPAQMAFGDTVRHEEAGASPLTEGTDGSELQRHKALTLPVSLIEEIDARRGATPFSEFVVEVLSRHLTGES